MTSTRDSLAIVPPDVAAAVLAGPVKLAIRLKDGGEVAHYRLGTAGAPAHGAPLQGPPKDLPSMVRRSLRIDESGQLVAWRRQQDDEWTQEPVILLPDAREVFSRNRGLLENGMLAQKSVAIIGLGSGGSIIADELAKAGVGRFILADFDRLEVANIGRHVCDLSDVGRRKTVAMRDRILRRNPYAKIIVFDKDVCRHIDELEHLLDHADVIVAATDNNASRNLLNRYAVESAVPMVVGRVYTRASGGDVIAVRPGGPCYSCIADAIPADEEISSERDLPAYSDHDIRIEPGLALDIAPIAHMCARLVLAELIRDTTLKMTSLLIDLSCPIFLWANRRDERFEQWPVMGQRVDGLAIQRWFGVEAQANPLCPSCQPEAYADSLADVNDIEAELRAIQQLGAGLGAPSAPLEE